MRAHRPAEARCQRVVIVPRYEYAAGRLGEMVGGLLVDVVVWLYRGWAGPPFPEAPE